MLLYKHGVYLWLFLFIFSSSLPVGWTFQGQNSPSSISPDELSTIYTYYSLLLLEVLKESSGLLCWKFSSWNPLFFIFVNIVGDMKVFSSWLNLTKWNWLWKRFWAIILKLTFVLALGEGSASINRLTKKAWVPSTSAIQCLSNYQYFIITWFSEWAQTKPCILGALGICYQDGSGSWDEVCLLA